MTHYGFEATQVTRQLATIEDSFRKKGFVSYSHTGDASALARQGRIPAEAGCLAWARAGGKCFAKAFFPALSSRLFPQAQQKHDLRSPGLASLALLLNLAVAEAT